MSIKKIYIVGIGPGNLDDMSKRAYDTLKNSDVIIGYSVYIDLIKDEFKDKEIISSGMKKEIERCKECVEIYKQGKSVALISSGDSGIYGMAGPMLEILSSENIPVEVIPGITSSIAGAALAGAPIMHDSATISLSDLMTDWDVIEKRIHCCSDSDLIISIYNPKSKGRDWQIKKAQEIMLKYKKHDTPVAILKNIGRIGESYTASTLKDFLDLDIDMFTMLIIGNSKTYVDSQGKMITPRGYKI
ncbi:MAG: precorrin-3B C(17)-methyltransferase [Fusobacteriaceae bacterium]|nr:precorrin-3B C(17)-methyltransferase [Fusobacteriaceae bacterium]MBP6323257.1 precorrin-3B C(17)-methyltransferase [Fusobacteriaceae bacterium]